MAPSLVCHSERSEESLFDLSVSKDTRREILRFAQNDISLSFSAACECCATGRCIVLCSSMSLSKARTVAFDALLRVAKQNAYADEVLRAELDASVKTEDAGLATELAMGVLRW